MPIVTRYVLDENGTVVRMNADELILEKEYFSDYTLDDAAYKEGFIGLTEAAFTGDEALITGATMTSNAVKTAVRDIFAAFNSLKENGGI